MKRSSSSRGAAAMRERGKELECGSPQPWACSSLAFEKCRSLHGKVLEEWEKRFASQEAPEKLSHVLPVVVEKPGNQILFPHITSRGSLAAKKAYRRTSSHWNIAGQPKSRTQRMHNYTTVLNYFQTELSPLPNSTTSQRPDHSSGKGQCRRLLLSLASAAGVRLIWPPVQLPLLEILLFFHQQLMSGNRAVRSTGGGGLWRFPLNLALATLRPFRGSFLQHCLTALLCLDQMRIRNNFIRQDLRFRLDRQHSKVLEKEYVECKKLTIRSDRVNVVEAGPTTEVTDNCIFLSNVIGLNVEGERMYKCFPIVEIMIGEREDKFSDNIGIFLDRNIFFKTLHREDFGASIVGFEFKGDMRGSPKPSPFSQESSFARTAENFVAALKRLQSSGESLASRKSLHVIVEDARCESFSQSDLAVPPTLQLRLELPSAVVRGKAFLRRDPETVLKDWNEEAADCRENVARCWAETVEAQPVEEFLNRKSGCLVEEKSADRGSGQQLEVCPIEDNRIGGNDFISPERLQEQNEVVKSNGTTAGNELQNGSFTVLVGRSCVTLGEVLERQVEKIQELEPTQLAEETQADENLDQKLEVGLTEKHKVGDGDSVCPERPQEQVEVIPSDTTGLGNELEKPAGMVFMEGDICEGYAISFHITTSLEINTGKEQDFSSPTRIWTTAGDYSPSETSIISRHNVAEEAESDSSHSISSTNAVVIDELNRAHKDEESEPSAMTLDIDSDLSRAHDVSELPRLTETASVNGVSVEAVVWASDVKCNVNEVKPGANVDDNYCSTIDPASLPLLDASSAEGCGMHQNYPEHPFADHPTCIHLRERRHSHGDQTFIDMQDLLPAPWGQLIFWHGRCKEGRPTLCVLLGKAIRQLPSQELKHFIAVTVSHLEYAEVNFFKGNVKQMNLLMDLEGLGFMRLPPMNILSSIGAILNRDYAGRGGWIILVNAPVMLGFVISAIQGVILRPSKGAVIDSNFRGFLEGKERIMMMGSRYKPVLQKYFDTSMLPGALGGDCDCSSNEKTCGVGIKFLELPWTCS